jgi:hypothetical protein
VPTQKKIGFVEPTHKKREVVQEFGIEFNELLDKCLKFIPAKYTMMSKKTFQFCFSQAKMAKAPSGTDWQAFENDRGRMSHLNFIEFIVFLCLLANELNRDAIIDEGLPFCPFMKETVGMLLRFFDLVPTEVPPEGEDTRGDNMPLYMLIGDKLEPYSPPTPEQLRESMHADFYSEASDHPASKRKSKILDDLLMKRKEGTVHLQNLKKTPLDSPIVPFNRKSKQIAELTQSSLRTEIFDTTH